jgi:hypothetical protein
MVQNSPQAAADFLGFRRRPRQRALQERCRARGPRQAVPRRAGSDSTRSTRTWPMHGETHDVARTDSGVAAVDHAAVEAQTALLGERLRRRSGSSRCGEPEELVEPHSARARDQPRCSPASAAKAGETGPLLAATPASAAAPHPGFRRHCPRESRFRGSAAPTCRRQPERSHQRLVEPAILLGVRTSWA